MVMDNEGRIMDVYLHPELYGDPEVFALCLRAIVKCGVWRSCSSLLMSLHFFHSIDEANIFHNIR